MRKRFIPAALFLLILQLFCDRQSVQADCRFFSRLINNGSYAVAGPGNGIYSACRPDTPYVPASIIKIPVSLAALHILGSDYRFTTEFFADENDNLYIRGGGDPFLVSEEIDLIFDALIDRGISRINGIYIDDSMTALENQVPGRGTSDNPYDVPVSAMAVNFNTVALRVLGDGRVESAEPQTPTLPIMLELGRAMPPGEYRLNICRDGCNPEERSRRYTVELFRALQEKKNIPGHGPAAVKKVPVDARLLYTHRNTRDLEDVIVGILKYSNNFAANLVFLQCGVQKYGPPATWAKAAKAVNETLTGLLGQEIAARIRIVEGSGLSRQNSITAEAMIRVLQEFNGYAHLLQKKKGRRVKSGSLDGVYNYAGYLAGEDPFVILLNQAANTRDEILDRLADEVERRRRE